jgi:hypothetical protein
MHYHAYRASRITNIDKALAATCASSQQRELITSAGTVITASRQAIVMASDVTHLGEILAGRDAGSSSSSSSGGVSGGGGGKPAGGKR